MTCIYIYNSFTDIFYAQHTSDHNISFLEYVQSKQMGVSTIWVVIDTPSSRWYSNHQRFKLCSESPRLIKTVYCGINNGVLAERGQTAIGVKL